MVSTSKSEVVGPRRVRGAVYFGSALLGGFAGATAIFIAVLADLDWECRHRNLGCHDGQGGIVLVELIPIMSIVGSALGLLWTWVTAHLPSDSMFAMFASVAVYDGKNKALNWFSGILVAVGLWCVGCYALFGALIYLDQF